MAKKKKQKRSVAPQQARACLVKADDYDTLCVSDYVSLDKNPEILTACRTIAELIASMTIYLMKNTDSGDVRIINALSRLVDIEPMPNMTRFTWLHAIVMNLLLYGEGNAIVVPHTYKGYIQSLEPISASRVNFLPVLNSYRDYYVEIDGKAIKPSKLLHFVYNNDKYFLWKGTGITVSIKDVANNLKQARATEKGFMESKWKPSLIVKVDAMTDEFSSKTGRGRLLEEYVKSSDVGEPWLIPAEQFDVVQVKPLSLADLAIKDTMELDKRTVASIIGVPPFILGVGEYSKEAWNSFIQNKVRPIALSIQQELTKKIIINDDWYLKFNTLSLMDWDLQTIYNVFAGLKDKGVVTGNEVRDRIGMTPIKGLDELSILENYIPIDKIGDQNKLKGE